MSSFTQVSWLGDFRSLDRYPVAFPCSVHSGQQRWLPSEFMKEPNSLTVARQRGILTRFPVHYEIDRIPIERCSMFRTRRANGRLKRTTRKFREEL
jgi:hypothetical protein